MYRCLFSPCPRAERPELLQEAVPVSWRHLADTPHRRPVFPRRFDLPDVDLGVERLRRPTTFVASSARTITAPRIRRRREFPSKSGVSRRPRHRPVPRGGDPFPVQIRPGEDRQVSQVLAAPSFELEGDEHLANCEAQRSVRQRWRLVLRSEVEAQRERGASHERAGLAHPKDIELGRRDLAIDQAGQASGGKHDRPRIILEPR